MVARSFSWLARPITVALGPYALYLFLSRMRWLQTRKKPKWVGLICGQAGSLSNKVADLTLVLVFCLPPLMAEILGTASTYLSLTKFISMIRKLDGQLVDQAMLNYSKPRMLVQAGKRLNPLISPVAFKPYYTHHFHQTDKAYW